MVGEVRPSYVAKQERTRATIFGHVRSGRYFQANWTYRLADTIIGPPPCWWPSHFFCGKASKNMSEMLLASAGGIFVGATFLIIIGIIVLTSIFWIWMLVDCLTSSLPTMEKLVWTLVIVFLHILGAILYFAIARKNRSR